jgi:hypothetical protein
VRQGIRRANRIAIAARWRRGGTLSAGEPSLFEK